MALAGVIGGAAVTGGQRLSTDSPVHFAVEGDVPPGSDLQWVCLPEGGIVGAPMVCRPKAEVVAAAREAAPAPAPAPSDPSAAPSTSTSTDN